MNLLNYATIDEDIMMSMNYSAYLKLSDQGYDTLRTNIDTNLFISVANFEKSKENEAVIELRIGNPLNITYDSYIIEFYFYDENHEFIKDMKYNTNEAISPNLLVLKKQIFSLVHR